MLYIYGHKTILQQINLAHIYVTSYEFAVSLNTEWHKRNNQFTLNDWTIYITFLLRF